jgi:hypothetical protein
VQLERFVYTRKARSGGAFANRYFVVIVVSALLHALIHPSAWNRNSRKYISKIVYSLTPVPLETPLQAPCIAPSDTACNTDG